MISRLTGAGVHKQSLASETKFKVIPENPSIEDLVVAINMEREVGPQLHRFYTVLLL